MQVNSQHIRPETSSIFFNTLLLLLTISRKKKKKKLMWIKDLNWEREMLLMCFHVTAITVRLPEANQLRQALTASKLCLIWCVHTEQWEQLQRTQLLSHPFWFMPGLGIWLPLPIRLIFFFSIAKRSGVYKNKRQGPSIPTLSWSVFLY